jgi:hypothetical protein
LGCLGGLSPSAASAGPWVPEPGEGYAKLWVKWLYGFGLRDGDGTYYELGTYNELFVSTYGEVGLVRNLAMYWHTDLLRTFYLEDLTTGSPDVHAGPGDPALGFRYQLVSAGRFVSAIEAFTRAPLASGDPVQPVLSREEGNPQIGELRIGAGAWDVGGGVSVGYGWDRFYAAASGAVIYRSEGYDDVITWTAEGGYNGGNGFAIRARLTGFHSLGNGSAPYPLSPSGQGNGTNYVGFAIETDWELWPTTFVGVTFEGGIAAIRRQTGGPVIDVYVAKKF